MSGKSRSWECVCVGVMALAAVVYAAGFTVASGDLASAGSWFVGCAGEPCSGNVTVRCNEDIHGACVGDQEMNACVVPGDGTSKTCQAIEPIPCSGPSWAWWCDGRYVSVGFCDW